MRIIVLDTGLFPDADAVRRAVDALAPAHHVVHLDARAPAREAAHWDRVLEELLQSERILTL